MSVPIIIKRQQEELMQIKERLAEIEYIIREIRDKPKPGRPPKNDTKVGNDAKT